WHRQTAARLVGARGNEEHLHRRLALWIRNHEDRSALDALWALYQAGGLDRNVASDCLQHPYAPVRAWAVRLVGEEWGFPELGGTIRILAAGEKDLEVQSQIASTAQRLPSATAMSILAMSLRQ
ncbi:MAG: hypothetical protein GWO24_23620, partial [Akkermansiaceae bacterium]|nr:hypothetical protein [Akkermansiaceae bacterium]